MTLDANGKIVSRCAAMRFVAKGASEQCMEDSHDLAKTRCRFASDAVHDEADRIAAELVQARRHVAEQTKDYIAALRELRGANETIAVRDETLALMQREMDADKELADARRSEAVLREALRSLLAAAVHEAMQGDGVSDEMAPHVDAATKALAGEL